jgi:DNA-binding GntR family transcriptional regulator
MALSKFASPIAVVRCCRQRCAFIEHACEFFDTRARRKSFWFHFALNSSIGDESVINLIRPITVDFVHIHIYSVYMHRDSPKP